TGGGSRTSGSAGRTATRSRTSAAATRSPRIRRHGCHRRRICGLGCIPSPDTRSSCAMHMWGLCMRIVHASVRAVPNHDEEDATFELAGLRTLDRRKLILGAGGSAAALAFMVNHPTRASARVSAVPADEDPFTLGVASGDPLPNG